MKKNILIVDDDAGISEVVKIILEDEGYRVRIVNESKNILTKVKEHKPDLVLLDIWMPIIDGTRVCRLLKMHKHTAHIPVVMISASVGTEQKSKEAGADDFLLKPFEMDELLDKIRTNLDGFRENKNKAEKSALPMIKQPDTAKRSGI